ncbi:hypothetical protein CU303_03980 [Prochlorococcus marinus str. MU1417]|nr:hypothetical protein [Prochlorococcus marinus str. MU1417]
MRKIKNYFLDLFNKRIFRFFGVGIIGEIFYLLLFSLFTLLNFKSTFSVLLSGIICIFFNSYMHAKFSFRMDFHFKFLFQYITIQLFCIFSTYILSFLFVWIGMNNLSIAFATLIIWGTLSFGLMNYLAK